MPYAELRPVTLDDRSVLRDWLSDDLSSEWAGGVGQLDGIYDDSGRTESWIILDPDQRGVGFISTETAFGEGRTVLLVVSPSHRGEGWATAGLDALIRHMEETSQDRIELSGEIHLGNAASIAAFESAGFERDDEPDGDYVTLRYLDGGL